MKQITTLSIFIFVLFKISFAKNPQWGSLKPGPYAVGFRASIQQDHRRYDKPKLNFEGEETKDEKTLPIQISIWYPAKDSKERKMPFEEYRNSFKKLTEIENSQANDNMKRPIKLGLGIEISNHDLISVLHTPTAAVKDARPIKDIFPLILCAQQSGPGQSSLLYEYLASYGYVIICTSVTNRQNTLMFSGGTGGVNHRRISNERVEDLEYVLEFSRSLPFVDKTKLGLLGINSEGISTLLFQMKNMQADAMVSIDGWETGVGRDNAAPNSVYFDINKIRIPYSVTSSDWTYLQPLTNPTQKMFDTLAYSTRYWNTINTINHFFLMENLGVLHHLAPEKKIAIEFLNKNILNFFDAYLKKSAPALAFLKKSAAENGFPDGMMKLEIKKLGLPPIPTNDELTTLFTEGQYDKIIRVLKEAKRLNPYLNNWGSILNNQGYSLLRNQKYPEAISIFRLNTELYSENAGWFDSLAEAYETSGDLENMKKASQQVLDLLSKKGTLTNNEKSMKEVAEKRLEK